MKESVTEVTINRDNNMIRVAMVKDGLATIDRFRSLPEAARFLKDHAGITLDNVKPMRPQCKVLTLQKK